MKNKYELWLMPLDFVVDFRISFWSRIIQFPARARYLELLESFRVNENIPCCSLANIKIHLLTDCNKWNFNVHFPPSVQCTLAIFVCRFLHFFPYFDLQTPSFPALLLFPQAFHLFLVLRRCHRRHEHATPIGDFDQVINNRTMTTFMVRLLVAPLWRK